MFSMRDMSREFFKEFAVSLCVEAVKESLVAVAVVAAVGVVAAVVARVRARKSLEAAVKEMGGWVQDGPVSRLLEALRGLYASCASQLYALCGLSITLKL